MKNLLEEIFGSKLELYREMDVKLPLYLKDGRLFHDIKIYGQEFVLVILPTGNRFNAATLKKQSTVYMNRFCMPVAYGFERITTFQRRSMIENQIPFVAGNGQIFLPFIGTCFSKCESGPVDVDKKNFTPATQMLFLLLLYNDDLWINKGKAASVLGITPMSVSRAAAQLKQLGIIEEKNVGTGIQVHRILSRREAYDAATAYLLNPVQKTVYVEAENEQELKYSAGEYALSLRSELGYPDYMEFAADKKAAGAGKWETFDPNLVIKEDAIRVQFWKYAPELFSQNSMVDPVSLMCSFKETQDERVHKCLEKIKKEIDGWKIEM